MSNEIIENKVDNNYIQEDEIDLKELFLTIKKNIFKIFFFVFIVICLTLVYALSIPNQYKSSMLLQPQGQGSSNVSGNLSSLASLAGINVGGNSGGPDPMLLLDTTLKDYEFNKYMIEKYDLINKLENPQNLVFALGIDSIYNFFNEEEIKESDIKEKIFNTKKLLSKIISISSDKKTGLINLEVKHEDRFFAKYLVDIYFHELIASVKKKDMKDLDKQISFYKTELNSVKDVALKEQLSKSLSGLLQKRVFSKANEYYFVSMLTDSRVPYIKEKVGPKRALILVVSAVTSFILAIFLVFFLEFIRNEKK